MGADHCLNVNRNLMHVGAGGHSKSDAADRPVDHPGDVDGIAVYDLHKSKSIRDLLHTHLNIFRCSSVIICPCRLWRNTNQAWR